MSTTSPDQIIAELVRRRLELGLNATTVAGRCGWVDRGSIIRAFETGLREPNPRQLRRWARELGMDIRLVPLDDQAVTA